MQNAQLESVSHAPVKEYRISDDGKIEARTLNGRREHDSAWKQVSPEHLCSHVRQNTAIARWLEQRLGWRRLLWACVADDSSNS